MTGEPPGFPEFVSVLARSRTLVVAAILVSLVAGLVVSVALPARYRATAILLPPDDRGLPPLTRTERESLAVNPGGPAPLEVLETPAGLAARLATSRPVIEYALRGLEPARGWAADGEKERVRRRLVSGLSAAVTDEKIVLVTVEADSAEWAARAANAVGAALNDYNVQRRAQNARTLAGDLEAEIQKAGARVDSPGAAALADRAELATLGEELARAREDAADTRPAVELLEKAEAPARPSSPVRWAVVGLFLFAGALGGIAGAFVRRAVSRG